VEKNPGKKEKMIAPFNDSIEGLKHAIDDFSSAIKICPEFYEALQYLGWCYDTLGDSEKAAGFFQQCHAIRPNEPIVAACLAQFKIRQNKLEEGQYFLRLAALLVPQDMNTRFNLGLGFKHQGNMASAIKELEYAEMLADAEASANLIRDQINKIG